MVANSHFQGRTDLHQADYTLQSGTMKTSLPSEQSPLRAEKSLSESRLAPRLHRKLCRSQMICLRVMWMFLTQEQERRASHCQKSLQSTQPFCIVTHESGSFILIINALTLGLKVLRNHWIFPAHLRLRTRDPAMIIGPFLQRSQEACGFLMM